MQLGEGVEWTLHVCALLATLPEGTTLSARRLAAFYDVPPAYLAKQLQALAATGIVATVRGRGGGYRLARPAAEIALLSVVEAVEGREPVFRCAEIRQRGPSAGPGMTFAPVCGIAAAMARAEAAWRAALRAQSVADLVAGMQRDVSPEQRRRARAWLLTSQRSG